MMERDKDLEVGSSDGRPEEVNAKDHGVTHERELHMEEEDIAKIERVYR